jgi:hypothetical protein
MKVRILRTLTCIAFTFCSASFVQAQEISGESMYVGGGEEVCHFGGQKGAGGVVTVWPTADVTQGHYVYDGLSSEGFTFGAR